MSFVPHGGASQSHSEVNQTMTERSINRREGRAQEEPQGCRDVPNKREFFLIFLLCLQEGMMNAVGEVGCSQDTLLSY